MQTPLRTVNDRVVNQETGLEYDGIAARILDEPKNSTRNLKIRELRAQGYPEAGIKAYWQAFDAHIFDETIKGPGGGTLNAYWQSHEAGHAAANATGEFKSAGQRMRDTILNQTQTKAWADALYAQAARPSFFARFLGVPIAKPDAVVKINF